MKSLEFTQAIIARLAGNSFQLKAWNVALASAVIGFVAKEAHPAPGAVFALVPALALWCLDAYYLALEALFRDLYDRLAQSPDPTYRLQPGPLTPALFTKALFRLSVVLLHLPLVITIAWVSRYR